MQSRLSLLILGFLGLCDAAHVADVATDALDQSTSPQAAVASALITSKTSFAKHVEGKTGFLPGLLEESEESESLLMESELEMDTKEDSEIISTPAEALSDNAFCSLLLVLRSILLALLLHLAFVVYKRKTQTEAETTRSARASASPCASKTWKTRTLNTSNSETDPKTWKVTSDSIDSDTHSTQSELSELHPQTPQTPQTVTSQRCIAAEVTRGKVGKVGICSGSGEFGEFELHVAAAEANLEDMAKLLKKGVDVNAVDAWDETALHMAARSRRGSFAACELLLQNKANVNARNADDRTPLACVTDAADDPVSLCHLLLQHGAVLGLSEDALQSCCATALVESLLRGVEGDEAEKLTHNKTQ